MTIEQEAPTTTETPATTTEAPAPSADATDTPATEASTPAPTAEAKPDPKGRAFAELARRERELRRIDARTKQEAESLKEAKAAAEAYRKELAEIKERPFDFLQKHVGLGFEDLTRKYLLSDPKAPTETQSKVDPKVEHDLAELKAWRAQQEEARQQAAQKQATEAQQALVNQHLQERLKYCQEHPGDFESIIDNQQAAVNVYMDLYRQGFAAKNELPSRQWTQDDLVGAVDLEEDELLAVLKRTEEILSEQEAAHLERLAKRKRFSGRFVPRTNEAPKDAKAPTSPTASAAEQKTLTNSIPRTPPPAGPNGKARTAAQIHAEALARIKAKFPEKGSVQ